MVRGSLLVKSLELLCFHRVQSSKFKVREKLLWNSGSIENCYINNLLKRRNFTIDICCVIVSNVINS